MISSTFFGDYLGRRSLYTPNELAFVDAGKSPELRLSFADANERAARLAGWLQQQGVGHGDRVAILAKDGVEHLDCFFACSKLGAVHTAMNWRLHPQEIVEIFESVQPNVLLFSADFAEGVAEIQAVFPLTLVHLEGQQVLDSTAYTMIQDEPRALEMCSTVSEEDIAALIFTGGTTGLPKAAKISHRQIGWNALNTVIHDLRHGDRYLNVFPLFHTGGMFVYTVPLVILGGTTVVLRQFDPNRVLEIIDAEEITVFAGVPTMYQMISVSQAWSTASLSSLRFCTSGGAPLPIELVRQYADEKGIQFKQGFGMTEFGPGVFALPPEEAIRKAGSIGRPNFFVDARVVDDHNQEQPVDVAGELILKGPSFCSGYYNNDAATQKVIDADGYFHTGDMAKVDQDGFFYIVDRKKDMFISGGENIYPAEIERVLSQHAAVYMCAVIGISDAKWGEVGKACVVLHDGQDVTEEGLLNFLKARLAKYKVPKTVVFLSEMPISGAGKILKRELKAQFEG